MGTPIDIDEWKPIPMEEIWNAGSPERSVRKEQPMPETAFGVMHCPFGRKPKLIFITLSLADAVNRVVAEFGLSFDESQELHDKLYYKGADSWWSVKEVPLHVA